MPRSSLRLAQALLEILLGPQRRGAPCLGQHQRHLVASGQPLRVQKRGQLPGGVNLVGASDPWRSIHAFRSFPHKASGYRLPRVNGALCRPAVVLRRRAAAPLGGNPRFRRELIQQRPGKGHVEKIRRRVHAVFLVEFRKLFQVEHGLVGGHPHRHAHHQRAGQNVMQRPRLECFCISARMDFSFAGIGGIEHVTAQRRGPAGPTT